MPLTLGLMLEVARSLRVGGVLILAAPNPSTGINAFLVLRGSASLWVTRAFLELPKVVDGKITDIGDVHFMKYRTTEVTHLLSKAGFRVTKVRYFAFGVTRYQSLLGRWVKTNSLARPRMRQRVFGAN